MFRWKSHGSGGLDLNGLPDIVGGSPVGAILSVPLAVDDKTLGKGENEGIRHTLGEAGEEVHACVTNIRKVGE